MRKSIGAQRIKKRYSSYYYIFYQTDTTVVEKRYTIGKQF